MKIEISLLSGLPVIAEHKGKGWAIVKGMPQAQHGIDLFFSQTMAGEYFPTVESEGDALVNAFNGRVLESSDEEVGDEENIDY